jgi:cytochrome oxidase Cu insertion factor (SCO1/SenC/PrrC family)
MNTLCARISALGLLTLALLVGCAQETKLVNSGTATSPDCELNCGARFVDFQFCDDQGKTNSLKNVKGQFTVLAFNSCDEDYNPALTHLVDFVGEKSNWRVRVVGVDIFWTPEGCVSTLQCAALPTFGNENFLAVCDGNGTIRKSYGVQNSGRYFIIDPNGKIVAKGELQNIECLRAILDNLIDDYLKEQEYFLKES